MDRNNVIASRVYEGNVALRKESVDRNPPMLHMYTALIGRSPQGERG